MRGLNTSGDPGEVKVLFDLVDSLTAITRADGTPLLSPLEITQLADWLCEDDDWALAQ